MQKIFVNGTILTMEKEQPVVEALLVEKDSIKKAGSREEVFRAAGEKVKIIDLKGRTLMPGFIDSHGHFLNTVMAENCFADVRCAPAIKPLLKLAYNPEMMGNLLKGIGRTSNSYLQKGVTTICEGEADKDFIQAVKLAMGTGQFPGRYLLCPSMTRDGRVPPRVKGKHIINGPVKLLRDGNIQCYAAALSQPYAVQTPDREGKEDYTGTAYMSVEKLRGRLETIMDSNRSFAMECNGDGAVEAIIEAMEGCRNLKKNTYKRNLLILCQTIRDEQLDKMKGLNLYPSFFTARIDALGDRYFETFPGEERAGGMNPAASAVQKEIPFTLHNDSSVTPAEPLRLVWNAVAGLTGEGRILGEEQRITVEEALKAVTIYAAYQYKAEDILGSIAEGKRADLIALSENPLEVPAEKLPDIRVERVWVDGRMVWSEMLHGDRKIKNSRFSRKAGKSGICIPPDFFSASCRRWRLPFPLPGQKG